MQLRVLPPYRTPVYDSTAEIDPGWNNGDRWQYTLEAGAGNVVGQLLAEIVDRDHVTWHWFLFNPSTAIPAPAGCYPIPAHGRVTLCQFLNRRPWTFNPGNWHAQGFPGGTQCHRATTDFMP